MSEKLADEREAKVEARQRKEGSKTPGSRFKNPRKQRELCLQKTGSVAWQICAAKSDLWCSGHTGD